MTFTQWLWGLIGGKRKRRRGGIGFAAAATALCPLLATGCAARATTSPDGSTTVEIDTRGGAPDSSRAVFAPTGPAAATHDATVNALLAQIARAATALDWRGFRQACANAMEWAHGRERDRKGERPDLGQDTPAVAGVRERADEAFWQELER